MIKYQSILQTLVDLPTRFVPCVSSYSSSEPMEGERVAWSLGEMFDRKDTNTWLLYNMGFLPA